ncbi:MAG: hypothetical protein AAB605_02760 [Patescibacteria group bacterium]
MDAKYVRGVSPIAITAALSVAVLIAAIGSYIGSATQAQKVVAVAESRKPAERQTYIAIEDADGNGVPDWRDALAEAGIAIATTTEPAAPAAPQDPLATMGSSVLQSVVSGYLSLKEYNQYTPARGEQLAQTIATNLRAPAIFMPHTTDELIIDADTSQERILRYRADMQEATARMVDFSAEPEFTIFARFIATEDTSWLDKLSATAKNYRDVEHAMLAVSTPASAIETHLRAVNALGKFTETLERLVRFANDPIATAALLRTYNEDEREMFLAFDALAKFYVAHVEN